MNLFEILSLVIIGSQFPLMSESRDFCQAFKDNDLRIDYMFEGPGNMFTAFIIGTDYWFLNFENSSISLKKKESRVSPIFDKTFLFAIEAPNVTNVFWFLNTTLVIQWRNLTFGEKSLDLSKASARHYKSTPNIIQKRSKPLVIFNSGEYQKRKRFTYIIQKPSSNTEEEIFEREYFSFSYDLNQLEINSYDVTKENDYSPHHKITNSSNGRGLLIGVSSPDKIGDKIGHFLFFSVNHTIEFCPQKLGVQADHTQHAFTIDGACSTNREILIDCRHLQTDTDLNHPTQPTVPTRPTKQTFISKYWIYILVVGVVVILLIIICSVIYIVVKRRQRRAQRVAKQKLKTRSESTIFNQGKGSITRDLEAADGKFKVLKFNTNTEI